MAISPNTRLGRYEIRSQLGAGGMGEVYLARDPKINRDVAIKVLPPAFSSDPERLRRFELEVEATGKLNHPNILSVYDVETQDGAPYVVYELLEGETLRERLNAGALSARKTVDYALQIANGLTAAHEKGIIHRDLKPDNVFITNDSRLKILDFGVAKLRDPAPSVEAQTDVLTWKANTDPGAVMGTVGYMSPEQVRGQKVDHRSDIFSLGVILYEMLSGKRAFYGDSAIETLNAILKEDPAELSESNSQINPALERVVMHCLEKRPEQRFQSANDVAFALEALSGLSSSRTMTAGLPLKSGGTGNRERLPWIVSGVLLLALLAALPFAIANLRRAPADERVLKLSVVPPENAIVSGVVMAVALSPDGRRLAFVATSEGQDRVWVRSLDSPSAQALAGTEGASNASLFWSPDSRFIGFGAGGKLRKIDASGGPPQTLCAMPVGRGGTWSRDGAIVFAPGSSGSLYRVSAAGGEPLPVTTLDQSRFETSHRWPYFLPDGRHFLYLVRSSRQVESGGIFVGSLDSKETKLLLPNTLNAAYAAPGLLLFLQNGTLMAQTFDVDERQLVGEPFPVAERVAHNMGIARGAFSVSENGVLAYCIGSGEANQPIWFDRSGKQIGSVGTAGLYFTVWLSPDENQAAVNIVDKAGAQDIWLFDLVRGVPTRFTTDPAGDSNPLWSPDGSRIVFSSNREGIWNLYQKIANGTGNEEILLRTSEEKIPDDWSRDGKFIVYQARNQKINWDLWLLPMFGDRQPSLFLQTEFNEQQAQFSPDGKWLAYTSDDSGAAEVYVQTFPASGSKWRVSTSGGSQPKWSRNGRELFYIAADRNLMAVDLKLGPSFAAGVPKALFRTRVPSLTEFRNHYAVTGDGQRFLINSGFEETASPISVVVNWTGDLKR